MHILLVHLVSARGTLAIPYQNAVNALAAVHMTALRRHYLASAVFHLDKMIHGVKFYFLCVKVYCVENHK